jgi:MFS family permease
MHCTNTVPLEIPFLLYHIYRFQTTSFPFIPHFISHLHTPPQNITVPRARGSCPKAASRIQPYRQLPHVCRPPSQQSPVYLLHAAPHGGDTMARSMGGPGSSRHPPSVFLPRISVLHTALPRSLTSIHSDLAFAFASTTSSPLSRHGHKFLLFASFVEGILGSQATIHAAVSAYVSDCTSDGSRAHIFSRFSGVSYVGFSIGPALGAFLIRHPLLQIQSFGRQHRAMHSVTAAFGAAILFSTINLLLILIIPESLDKAKQRAAQKVDDPDRATQSESSLKERLLTPLAIFAPRKTMVNGRMREDWSMPWLAAVVFILYLAGVRNLSFLRYYQANSETPDSHRASSKSNTYMRNTYSVGMQNRCVLLGRLQNGPLTLIQLGYYISFIGAVRAFDTLLLMPCGYCQYICSTCS